MSDMKKNPSAVAEKNGAPKNAPKAPPQGNYPPGYVPEEGERRHRERDPSARRGGGHGPRRGMPGEKPKDFKGTVRKLAQYLSRYLPLIVLALICAGVSSILSILSPDYMKRIITLIEAGLGSSVDMDAVMKVCVTLLCIHIISALLGYVQSLSMATVTQRISQRMRKDIDRKINRLPLSYFDSTSFGNVLSRVTNDVDTISHSLNGTVISLLTNVLTFVGSLFMMLRYSWILTLCAIGATVIGFAFMGGVVKKSQKYFMRSQNYLGDLNGHVEELYSAHTVVKAYNGEAWAKEEFDDFNNHLRDNQWKGQFLGGMMHPFMGFVGNLGYVVVCVVGSALAIAGKIEFGVIVAFMTYIRMFTQPLSSFAQIANTMQSTAAAGERVFEFLNEKELSDESHKTARLDSCRGEVTFENVKFGYTPDRVIIHNFSAVAKPGQKVAIVGPTGAGKTTMVRLLMRFYDVTSGRICVDGHDVRDFDRNELRLLFGMVLQDTWLFGGTIAENIRYGRLDATDEEVVAAAKAAHAHHFIKTLPGGYQMVLNEESSNISQGQKQLLTIARAILADPRIMILDEATSSVDTRTEQLIQQGMNELMKGRTSFVIAHRLSTIRDADLILVMRDGDIVEQGNHEELLAKEGFYAQLYRAQFEKSA